MRGLFLVVTLTAYPLVADPTIAIKVDQVGYLPNAPKLAAVAANATAEAFIVRTASGAVAFQGKLGPAVDEPDSGDRVQLADFTALTKPGKYYLDVPGVGRSWEFSIASDGKYVASELAFGVYRLSVFAEGFAVWTGLAMALRDQQISDFTLCNKSFNLSYCGHDL